MALTRVTNKYIYSMSGSKLEGTFPESPKVDGGSLSGLSGVDTIARTNLALNYFKDSVNNNTDRMALEQGWIDTFEDESDVDNGTNTSLLNLVRFDGVDDYMSQTSGILPDGKNYTFSCWLRKNTDGTDQTICDTVNTKFLIKIGSDNKLELRFRRTADNTNVAHVKSTNTITVSNGLIHLLITIEAANATAADRVKCRINGVDETLVDQSGAPINDTVDPTDTTFYMFANGTPSNYFDGDIAQLYLTNEFLDPDIEENIRKFISKDRQPVDLGQNGEKPTGNQPAIYLSNPASSFETNLGNGGGLNLNSSLSTVPSNSNVPMVKFDGVNDRLTNSTNANWVDSSKGTVAFWFDLTNTNDADGITFMDGENGSTLTFRLIRCPSSYPNPNAINMQARAGNSSIVIDVTSQSQWTASDGMIHVAIAWDLAPSTPVFQFSINGVIQSNHPSLTSLTQGATVDHTISDFFIGQRTGGPGIGQLQSSIGQIYFNIEDYVDLSVQANRDLFYKDGKPVDLGSDGSKPTGSTPLIYLNNPYGSFQNNAGTGGNFSVTGELVDGGYITDKIYDSGADSFSNSYELIDSYGKENDDESQAIGNQASGTSGDQDASAVCINLPNNSVITSIAFKMTVVGSPTGTISAHIQGIGSGSIAGDDALPDNNSIAVSTPIDVSTMSANNVVTFQFPEPVTLSAGDYAFVVDGKASGATSNYVSLKIDNTAHTHAGNTANHHHQNGWEATTWMALFYLYGHKNLDLITKGSDDIGNSPSVAPEKGHMEVLMTERPASGTTTWSDTLDANSGLLSGIRGRSIIKGNGGTNNLNISGDRIRICIEVGDSHSGGFACDYVSIVERNGATSSGVTIPTEIKFGNSSGFSTIPTGGKIWSDWVDFKINASKDYLINYDFSNAPSGSNHTARTNTSGDGTYFQMSPGSNHYYNSIDFGSTSGQTLDSTLTLAVSEIQVETQQTLNAGGDIIAEMSRGVDGNGDKVWSPVTLTRTKTQVADMSYNILAGEADFTDGDPSGTNIVGRIRTGNKDKITVKGISVNWK